MTLETFNSEVEYAFGAPYVAAKGANSSIQEASSATALSNRHEMQPRGGITEPKKTSCIGKVFDTFMNRVGRQRV